MESKMKNRLADEEYLILKSVFDRWRKDYLRQPENGEKVEYFYQEDDLAGFFPVREEYDEPPKAYLQDENGYDLVSVGMNKQGFVVFFFQGLDSDDRFEVEAAARPCYVTMTDTFFSGWGSCSGMKNKLAIECKNYADAEIVMENARNRGDQKNINVTWERPMERKGILWNRYNKGTYSKWFKPGAF